MTVSRKQPVKATLFPDSNSETMPFKVNEPDWEKARTLALRAVKKAESKDFKAAIADIEVAIKLDLIAALNHFHSLRAEFYAEIGETFPRKALDMYSHGYHLAHTGRYRDAALAYQEAARIDPLFLWPLNNLAWMLSTNKDRSVCDGAQAVAFALEVCEKSNWNCWAFLGTLAAAYAASGDFARQSAGSRQTCPLSRERTGSMLNWSFAAINSARSTSMTGNPLRPALETTSGSATMTSCGPKRSPFALCEIYLRCLFRNGNR